MENNNNFAKMPNRPRSKKLRPKIDFAAMVSVSFLLIVFFMVTKELSKPRAMYLGLPDGGCCGPDVGCYKPDFRRMVTILLDDKNKIISYRGILEYPEKKPEELDYGKNGIREELLLAKAEILKATGDIERGAIVIIKPSKKSNYGNLVDILDEMAITRIPTYAILNDFTPEEEKLLASN